MRQNERRKQTEHALHSNALPRLMKSPARRRGPGKPAQLIGLSAASASLSALYLALPVSLVAATLYYLLVADTYSPRLPFIVNVANYALPLISASAFMAVLLRPLFPRQAPKSQTIPVSSQTEQITALAKRVAAGIGIAHPVAIEISLDPSIDVMQHGTGKRTTLTLAIGLPYLAYLPAQELTALIAQALAPYTHSTSAVSHRLVFGIRRKLNQNISGEDGWRDLAHDLTYEGKNSAETISGLILQGGLWVSDRLLLLLKAGIEPLATRLQSLLDVDADRLAAHVGGSEVLSCALDKQHKLQLAWALALSRVNGRRQEHYPDNLAIVACRLVREVSSTEAQSASEATLQARIREVQDAGEAGLLMPELAGTMLSDESINRLGRDLSLRLYQEMGIRVSASSLQAVARRDGYTERLDTAQELLNDYSSGAFDSAFVWDVRSSMDIARMPDDKKQLLANAAVQRFRQHLPDYQEALNRVHECERQSADAIALVERRKFGYVTEAMYEHYRADFKRARARLERYRDIIGQQQRCGGTRLAATVLLSTDQAELSQILQLMTAQQQLHGASSVVTASRTNLLVLKRLEQKFAEENELELKPSIERLCENLQSANRRLRDVLLQLPSSAIPAIADVRKVVSERLANSTPEHAGQLSHAMSVTRTLLELYEQFNLLASAELVRVALAIETKAGIEPVCLISKSRAA